jgi:hypothetical protein
MAWGIGAGPQGAENHRSTHHVYDTRDGRILATFQFVGSPKEPGEELHRRLAKQVNEASDVPLEHIDVLTGAEIPEGDGPLHVDPEARQVRRTIGSPRRIRA